MVRVTIRKEFNKNFGKNIYVISVNGNKEFFEFTKVKAEKKAKSIAKKLQASRGLVGRRK